MTSTPPLPVLIVGAGTSGLTLALTLAQNAIKVRVIEMDENHHVGQRGAGIQPRTLEAYNFLGILPDIYARGIPLMPMRAYRLPGGVEPLETFDIVPIEEPTPSAPFINPFLLGQPAAEEIMRTHLDKYGCHVELGTELRTLEQHDDHVTARIVKRAGQKEVEETVECRWLVGADGAKSGIVRKQMGATFLGETIPQKTLVGLIEVKNLTAEASHYIAHVYIRTLIVVIVLAFLARCPLHDVSYLNCCDASKALLWLYRMMLRPTELEGTFAFSLGGSHDRSQILSDDDALAKALREATQRSDIEFGKITWKSHYVANVRMVNKFGEGRVFVVGDAAHVHSPAGGQGLNSGVQDSFNLGWKIALVEKGLAAPSLLATYSEERIPVIRHMLGETTRIYNRTLNPARENDSPNMGWKSRVHLKQLGINCRWSSIVVDERHSSTSEEEREPLDAYSGDGILRAGDRAPDAPGLVGASASTNAETTSLFRVFKPSHHTVLLFSAEPTKVAPALDALKGYPEEVICTMVIYPKDATAVDGAEQNFMDRDGHAFAGYGVSADETIIVVVRPDGVVGCVVRGVEGLKTYFRGVFSAIA
ncbi:uncharacterized protein FIBRA_03337 [Fibroporia radiculosa]|uniref:Uncharacterized protein n=1 Tax=Fibroporia radiculosa TaxID=599839 RepID=J4G535_9APHY|nr:uncharacterized protein FIBRA_03337 [Fibroporia radiculosa]CCM01288.1 predicted protein [Fibroporia radiculosa]